MSLAEFMERIRGNKWRLRRLFDSLDWVIIEMYSVPGPVYDRVGSSSNVHENRLCVLIDKENEIKAKIQKVYDDEALLHRFEKCLTEKELKVFKMIYLRCRTQEDTGLSMGVSQQCVGQYVAKILKKWEKY